MEISHIHKISDMHVGGFKGAENPKEFFELIVLHKQNFKKNLENYKKEILENKEYSEIAPNVFAHESAVIDRSVVYNTTNGIIVLEKDARVLPFVYLVGPLRIDENATINPHSNISGSYIGKFCKIGGEVANSVFESYTNKAHLGGMYDAYVGSWVNIGGGTSNSNLKNTYGTVKMRGMETNEQFMGCVIADHVKTAINVSIYTGKIIGVGSHIYGTVVTDVPSFTNYITKDNLVLLPLEVAIKTAERMCARRNITLTEEDKKVLQYAYTSTEKERTDRGVKEGKLLF